MPPGTALENPNLGVRTLPPCPLHVGKAGNEWTAGEPNDRTHRQWWYVPAHNDSLFALLRRDSMTSSVRLPRKANMLESGACPEMKFAYFAVPHMGGTYTLFTHLRSGLAPLGIDVEWLGLTDRPRQPYGGSQASGGLMVHCAGRLSGREQAEILTAAIEQQGLDGVFVNVLADGVQMNLARYLPRRILRIMIVHNITPGTYAAARAIRDHVHATVGVSQRCHHDLVTRHGFDRARTHLIPNAVDVARFSAPARPARNPSTLRALYLGRVEDASKGVMWLPRIMAATTQAITLTVAGDGPDLGRLMTGLKPFGDRVSGLGAVSPADIPALLARHDVLIMPSRYEGLPLTLAEAMAAGCVPVVSAISGVTDTIVEHGVSGLMFPVGDCRRAALELDELARNRVHLALLSAHARQRAGDAFPLERMADAYGDLIGRIAQAPPEITPPLSLNDWAMPMGMRPGLRTYLPEPVKNWLRMGRERVHLVTTRRQGAH